MLVVSIVIHIPEFLVDLVIKKKPWPARGMESAASEGKLMTYYTSPKT